MSTTSSSSSSHDGGDGGREFEEPLHARQRFNNAVWPEPFLDALATQVAMNAVTSPGRLAAAPAICNLFQVRTHCQLLYYTRFYICVVFLFVFLGFMQHVYCVCVTIEH